MTNFLGDDYHSPSGKCGDYIEKSMRILSHCSKKGLKITFKCSKLLKQRNKDYIQMLEVGSAKEVKR